MFTDDLGTVQLMTVSLAVKESSQPKFFVLNRCHLQGAIKVELYHLEQASIMEKVETSRWATPIVPVPKKGRHTALKCGDYKVTINPALEVDQHPLPKPEETFTLLAGGQMFSKLDLSQAYQQQLPLNEAAKELVTTNTYKGLYCYTCLPFGVASAPAIFQPACNEYTATGSPKCVMPLG